MHKQAANPAGLSKLPAILWLPKDGNICMPCTIPYTAWAKHNTHIIKQINNEKLLKRKFLLPEASEYNKYVVKRIDEKKIKKYHFGVVCAFTK